MEKREAYTCYNCFSKYKEDTCPYCGFDRRDWKDKFPFALPAGSVLSGKFILGRVLGEGRYGITYIAQDWKIRQRVVIKEFFPGELAERKEAYSVVPLEGQEENFVYGRGCFLEEAKKLAEFVDNPNIVHICSCFEENGTAYYVMEYIEGISFDNYVEERGGKLPWEEALRCLRPIADALSVVHDKGMLHRNLGPDSILITGDGTAKLIDFGYTRYCVGEKIRSLYGVLKPGYAPKEQYLLRGNQGPYTDVYSLAAIFYMAMTGEPPMDSIDRIEGDDIKKISHLGIEIPEYADSAIMKGIQLKSSDRFQSMREFTMGLSGQEIPQKSPVNKDVNKTQQKKKKLKQKFPYGIAVSAAVVCIAVIVALATGKDGKIDDKKKEKKVGDIGTLVSEQDDKASLETENDALVLDEVESEEFFVGNRPGNICNNGIYVEDDKNVYYYFSTDPGNNKKGVLRASDKYTFEGTTNLSDECYGSLNYKDGWIYYLKSNAIARIRTDGTQGEDLITLYQNYNTRCWVINDWLYYSDSHSLYRVPIDDWGNEEEVVSDLEVEDKVVFDSSYIFYSVEYSHDLCRVDLDGGSPEIIEEKDFPAYLDAEDGWVYYSSTKSISKIQSDGSGKMLIYNYEGAEGVSIHHMIEAEGYCYFTMSDITNGSIPSSIWRVGTDKSGLTKLYECKNNADRLWGINIVDDTLYFYYQPVDQSWAPPQMLAMNVESREVATLYSNN